MKCLWLVLVFSVIAGHCFASAPQVAPQFFERVWARGALPGPRSPLGWKTDWPKLLGEIKSHIKALSDQVDGIHAPLVLREKVNMFFQLWKIRQCLNVAALLEPEPLQYVTGMDPKQFRVLIDQFKSASTNLKRKLLDAGTIQSSKLNART